jgi:hypothetical protein
LTFGRRDKEEPMKVRARELAIAQNWKWKFRIWDGSKATLHRKWSELTLGIN